MVATVINQSRVLRGELPEATHVGTSGEPGEGPFVRFWLQIQDFKIVDASYSVPGCPSSIAAASMTLTLVKGRNVNEALKLENEDLLLILGGLPDGRGHLAGMCVEALHEALKEFR